jgi:hypothetical protein
LTFVFIKVNGRSRSEDSTNKKKASQLDEIQVLDSKVGSRRSRRLQKKNSLDVQFRRRFSILRGDSRAKKPDANRTNDSSVAYGDETENSVGKHVIDKRFNKILFNMHGIPVNTGVTVHSCHSSKEKKIAPLPPSKTRHQKTRISSNPRSMTQNV